jgi:hypothetical protein
MAIINTITSPQEFAGEFERKGRGDQFSWIALEALFYWLDELPEPHELDVVGLCCEFAEYNDLATFNEESGEAFGNMEDLSDQYFVIPTEQRNFLIGH